MCVMALSFAEWWITEGINFLKGIPQSLWDSEELEALGRCGISTANLSHGANLPDHLIICLFRTVPEARASAQRLLATLTAEEKVRIFRLLSAAKEINTPDFERNEAFMRVMNPLAQVPLGPGPISPTDPRGEGISK